MVEDGASEPSAVPPGSAGPARPAHEATALRQAVLAVSVLHDVDVEPRRSGVLLPGRHTVLVPWTTLEDALAGAEPTSPAGRRRVELFLRLRRLVADLGADAGAVLETAARGLALPVDHVDHLGPQWVRETVLGGDLDLGVGLLGLLPGSEEVVPLPPQVARAAVEDTRRWWPRLRGHVEAMGSLAAHRLAREEGASRHSVLRPVGGCEVPTLLASRTLRRYLAGSDGSGLRAVAVPMRTRGWYDLARIDPAFVGAAWAATREEERGLSRPVLVTADEVRMAVVSERATAAALADPAAPSPLLRDVRYR